MTVYKLILQDWCDEEEQMVEAKGYYPAAIEFDGQTVQVEFYDPVRLSQTVDDDVARQSYFVEQKKIIVVEKVTRGEMEKAARKAAEYTIG